MLQCRGWGASLNVAHNKVGTAFPLSPVPLSLVTASEHPKAWLCERVAWNETRSTGSKVTRRQ